jgi:cardiolipin synthase
MPLSRFSSSFCWLPIVLASLSVSCTTISTNSKSTTERRLQANDTVSGTGAMARSVLRATALAAVREPVTTVKLGLANLWHRPRGLVSGNLPPELVTQPAIAEVPGSREFEQLLDRNDFPRAESGTLRWLVDGDQFFPELDRQLDAASRSINIQVFIFDNDDIAVRYADKLRRRAKDVPVHVLYDDLGSTFAHTAAPETLGPRGFVPPPEIHHYLEADSKVRVRRILNPWLVCDHTKLLVFDQRTAIVGGMNIGREYYSEWHDLMVRVDGPVVGTMSREFSRAWRKAGPWGDFALLRPPAIFRRPKPVADGIGLRVLRTDAAEGRYEIFDSTLLAIRGARKRIYIETPYFADDEIAAACAAAARRGVDVRVILPSVGDSTIMDAGNLATANGLIRAGVRVYRYPKMTHMKVLICDNWASVGSANLDILSMRINRELNLAFSDPATVKSLEEAVFKKDFRISRRIRLAETQTATASWAEIVADQL